MSHVTLFSAAASSLSRILKKVGCKLYFRVESISVSYARVCVCPCMYAYLGHVHVLCTQFLELYNLMMIDYK